jgi:hypothetical protein
MTQTTVDPRQLWDTIRETRDARRSYHLTAGEARAVVACLRELERQVKDSDDGAELAWLAGCLASFVEDAHED